MTCRMRRLSSKLNGNEVQTLIIENNILKYHLRNVYFITGTAYAGKSTAVRMLADRYDMVFCGENYHITISDQIATPDLQPDLCYRRNLKDWKDFVTRAPEEYERWIYNSGREGAGFEIAQLISLAEDKKVIVDTCIPSMGTGRICKSHLEREQSFVRFKKRTEMKSGLLLKAVLIFYILTVSRKGVSNISL